MSEYAEYGFDQQRLIWYVFRLWDLLFSWSFRALAHRQSRCEVMLLTTYFDESAPQWRDNTREPVFSLPANAKKT